MTQEDNLVIQGVLRQFERYVEMSGR
jgi:hypothetical protein